MIHFYDISLLIDLSLSDVTKVVEEIIKYPTQAVELLAQELGVEGYFKEQQKQGQKGMWLLLAMMNEWQKHLNEEDESPKKVLARHLVAVDGKYKELTAKKTPKIDFIKLARKIDMQGKTSTS